MLHVNPWTWIQLKSRISRSHNDFYITKHIDKTTNSICAYIHTQFTVSFLNICLSINYCWGHKVQFRTGDYIRSFYLKSREKNADICSTPAGQWDYLQNLLRNVWNGWLIQIAPLNSVSRRNGQYTHLMSPALCQMTTLEVFFQFPVKCECLQCWSRDKDWETAASENLRRGERGQRNANSGFCLWVSDCSARPFSKSLPGPLWMDANYHAQQCFSTIL